MVFRQVIDDGWGKMQRERERERRRRRKKEKVERRKGKEGLMKRSDGEDGRSLLMRMDRLRKS